MMTPETIFRQSSFYYVQWQAIATITIPAFLGWIRSKKGRALATLPEKSR
jgi:hypothetical protein